LSELKQIFVSSANLLFALSNVGFITQLFFLAEMPLFKSITNNSSLHSFAMSVPFEEGRLVVFKMGVKNVRITTMPMRSQHDVFFQIYHDSFFFAAMPSFQIRHDSFFFATMPSFQTTAIVSSLPRCLLSKFTTIVSSLPSAQFSNPPQ
jgi:hypothetical protein